MTREEAMAILEVSKHMATSGRMYNQAIDMAIEALTLQNLTEPNNTCEVDLISRADAIEAVEDLPNAYNGWSDAYDKACIIGVIEEVPSADAEPIVIRSRTLLPTKDFKEWAKRIKEVNPNAVVIPCDAEAVQGEWEHWGSPFSDESEVVDTIVCSVCGARFIEPKEEYNFCPNCGTKMDEDGQRW